MSPYIKESVADIALAYAELGYTPVVDVEEGLMRLVQYVRGARVEHVKLGRRCSACGAQPRDDRSHFDPRLFCLHECRRDSRPTPACRRIREGGATLPTIHVA